MLAVLKTFLSKYILEVVPSVVASVLGAYIVTHYINARPEDKSTAVPAISATVSDPATKGAKIAAERAKPADAKSADTKSADAKSSDDGKALDQADAGQLSADSDAGRESRGPKSGDEIPQAGSEAGAAGAARQRDEGCCS